MPNPIIYQSMSSSLHDVVGPAATNQNKQLQLLHIEASDKLCDLTEELFFTDRCY